MTKTQKLQKTCIQKVTHTVCFLTTVTNTPFN